MNEKKPPTDEPRTGHIYDGIEELDYAPPKWFQALFYSTIAFGIPYWFYFTLGGGISQKEEYEQAKLADEVATLAVQKSTQGQESAVTEEQLLAVLKNPEQRKLGGEIFQAKCVSCHGAQGQGGIGPNLTDSYWIHGGKLTEILQTIRKGVPEKGMVPWEGMLKPEESMAVTAFIRGLLGSNPPGAKAPQGDLVKIE